jgi:hypothetical protein
MQKHWQLELMDRQPRGWSLTEESIRGWRRRLVQSDQLCALAMGEIIF